MNKLKISLMVFILLLIGGCGTPMKQVMQQCDRGQAFDSFAYCVKRTYANEGTKPNDSAVRTFYANLDMITEAYNNKRITEAEAKSLTWNSYMKTIQASNDQADASLQRSLSALQQMQTQQQQRTPIQTQCIRNGVFTNCTTY